MHDVIILEDNQHELELINRIVENIDSKLKVFKASLAQQALDIAETHNIKLFILDVKIPDFSGIEFARKIREMDKYKMTNIVFITTVSDSDFTVFKELHCYDYILKPFNEEYVRKTLGNIIKYGVNKLDDSYFEIKHKSFKFRIKEEDIYYIERINRRAHLFTKNKEHILSNISLNKILSQLPSYFIQCRRGIIVNVRKIDHVDYDENIIYLKDMNAKLPIGDKYKDELDEKLC